MAEIVTHTPRTLLLKLGIAAITLYASAQNPQVRVNPIQSDPDCPPGAPSSAVCESFTYEGQPWVHVKPVTGEQEYNQPLTGIPQVEAKPVKEPVKENKTKDIFFDSVKTLALLSFSEFLRRLKKFKFEEGNVEPAFEGLIENRGVDVIIRSPLLTYWASQNKFLLGLVLEGANLVVAKLDFDYGQNQTDLIGYNFFDRQGNKNYRGNHSKSQSGNRSQPGIPPRPEPPPAYETPKGKNSNQEWKNFHSNPANKLFLIEFTKWFEDFSSKYSESLSRGFYQNEYPEEWIRAYAFSLTVGDAVKALESLARDFTDPEQIRFIRKKIAVLNRDWKNAKKIIGG